MSWLTLVTLCSCVCVFCAIVVLFLTNNLSASLLVAVLGAICLALHYGLFD